MVKGMWGACVYKREGKNKEERKKRKKRKNQMRTKPASEKELQKLGLVRRRATALHLTLCKFSRKEKHRKYLLLTRAAMNHHVPVTHQIAFARNSIGLQRAQSDVEIYVSYNLVSEGGAKESGGNALWRSQIRSSSYSDFERLHFFVSKNHCPGVKKPSGRGDLLCLAAQISTTESHNFGW